MRATRVIAVTTAVLAPLAASSIPAAGSDCTGRVAPSQAGCTHQAAAAQATRTPLRFFITPNPQTTPPLHGTLAHGQGTAAVIQLNPDAARPYSNDPAGANNPNQELIVVGRARGEQRADGTYHGHITIAAIAGNEILGVDTNPGETKTGPLSALQQNVLNALCTGSGNSVCLSAVVANSTTTTTGSTNHFEAANASLGNANPGTGITASAVSSDGNITTNGQCQTATGGSRLANVTIAGTVLANVIQSSTVSNAGQCGATPPQQDSSVVVQLGGAGVPLPAPGCADGTANTVTGVAVLLPIVCNADDSLPGTNGVASGGQQATSPYGVREALDVFVLATPLPPTSAAKVTAGASESHAIAPAVVPPVCPSPPGAGPCPPVTPACPSPPGTGPCPPVTPACPSPPGTGPCAPTTTTPATTTTPVTATTPANNGNAGNAGSSGNGNQNRCNANGDNDCVTGNGPFGPSIPEAGATDRARDCAEGITFEGPVSCPAGPAVAIPRSSLPFTG